MNGYSKRFGYSHLSKMKRKDEYFISRCPNGLSYFHLKRECSFLNCFVFFKVWLYFYIAFYLFIYFYLYSKITTNKDTTTIKL